RSSDARRRSWRRGRRGGAGGGMMFSTPVATQPGSPSPVFHHTLAARRRTAQVAAITAQSPWPDLLSGATGTNSGILSRLGTKLPGRGGHAVSVVVAAFER